MNIFQLNDDYKQYIDYCTHGNNNNNKNVSAHRDTGSDSGMVGRSDSSSNTTYNNTSTSSLHIKNKDSRHLKTSPTSPHHNNNNNYQYYHSHKRLIVSRKLRVVTFNVDSQKDTSVSLAYHTGDVNVIMTLITRSLLQMSVFSAADSPLTPPSNSYTSAMTTKWTQPAANNTAATTTTVETMTTTDAANALTKTFLSLKKVAYVIDWTAHTLLAIVKEMYAKEWREEGGSTELVSLLGIVCMCFCDVTD
jgi:hypothetical protein